MKTLTPEKRPYHWYLALLFLCMFVLTSMSPLAMDDYNYCYNFEDFSRITNPLQIIPSMAAHRVRPNGRVFAHGMVQLFMLMPKGVFNLCNAGNAVLLAVLFARYFPEKKPWELVLLLACGAMIVWNFSPSFGHTFLWLDGALNYSWALTVLLLFLWPYARAWLQLPAKPSVLRTVLFCLLAFVAGSYSENGSIAMLFAAFCLSALLLLRDRKLPLPLVLGLLLGLLGFYWLMHAPGTTYRGAERTLSILGENYRNVVESTRGYLLPLYLGYGMLLAAAIHFRADRKRLLLSVVLILAGLGSLACFVFALYFFDRHFCFTVVTAALACLLLLAELGKTKGKLLVSLCTGALSVLFLFNAAAGGMDILVGFTKTLERERVIREAQAAGQSIVVVDEHIGFTNYSVSFILAEDGRDWPNMWMAKYYGFDVFYKTGTEPGA
ncbi:MAG: hypothetical protein J5927_02045 [Oscillospiraceae bacterium]|nr:hypothetical protein [Oscillospiraceae bacterium]